MEQLATDLWVSDGPVVTAALGFHYPTRMVVIRLTGGGLWVWSPVALRPLRPQVEALDAVQHIVQPSALHDTWVAEWRAAYPDAQVWGADFGAVPWREDIDHVTVPNWIADETVFYHRASETVLICDLLQQVPRGWYAGWWHGSTA